MPTQPCFSEIICNLMVLASESIQRSIVSHSIRTQWKIFSVRIEYICLYIRTAFRSVVSQWVKLNANESINQCEWRQRKVYKMQRAWNCLNSHALYLAFWILSINKKLPNLICKSYILYFFFFIATFYLFSFEM